MNNSLPLVSIICPAYNHEKYIEKALAGFVMQKTNFPFEIIVHDDASTDNTTDIIRRYEASYSHLFANIYQTENQFSKPVPLTIKAIFTSVKGKYVAFCDGDDYWTDPYKLQKQIDFLEQNRNFSICFHNAKIIYEEDPQKETFSNPPDQKEITQFEDLAKGEFIYTPTCVFRMKDFQKFPEQYYTHINNYTLDLHNAQYGSIKYINEVMCVYRRHKGGIWSMVSREKTLITQMPTYKFYLGYFGIKYRKYFLTHLKNMTAELINLKLNKKDYDNFWQYYKDYIFYNIKDKSQVIRMPAIFLKASSGKLKKLFSKND